MHEGKSARSTRMEQDKNLEEKKKRELAMAYAKYLRDHNLEPGDKTFIEPGTLKVEPTKAELPKPPQKARKRNLAFENTMDILEDACAAPMYAFDRFQDRVGDALAAFGRGFIKEFSRITGTYKSARRTIATACLVVCVLCSVMLIIFDKFTVYEYAYNGKVLGYVGSQEDVTNVLDVAGSELNEVNEDVSQEIEFIANDNISFNLVRSAGKDIDDADTTINKLAYMTDVEVVASAVYDGENLVTIVKDDNEAERLLADVKAALGTPDEGMELVSSDFSKPLEIKPINVLLSSVQSNSEARKQMTEGGKANFYRLVEQNENAETIAQTFGVDKDDIYNEKNTEVLKEVTQGDKICIHKEIKPVSVELVESGKMKEIVPFETIEKKTKDLYIGDEEIEVKGVKGVQIFEGTLTKVGGKVVTRDTKHLEVITEKVDQVVYIGTTKRPKTAPTGIFNNPMKVGTYTVTSRPGWRWGRVHEGVDLGSPTGTHVFASDGGVIIRAGYFGGYGNCIEIQHSNGWMTRYGHLSYMGVHVGQKVYQGQYIGNVGNTGNSTGSHLHFETRKDGKFVDPDSKVKGGL